MKKLLALFVLTLATVFAAPSEALANDTPCMGTLTGTFDNVIVPPGATCALINSTVNGSVKALENSRLTSLNNIIRGNIEGDKADTVQSIDDTVGGNIQIKEATNSTGSGTLVVGTTLTDGNIEIEKNDVRVIILLDNRLNKGSIKIKENNVTLNLTIDGNTVAQNLQVEENNVIGALSIPSNKVGQNLQVFKNRGPAAKSVQFNTVGENLQCRENDPVFVGTPNIARQSEGQCGTP